MAVMDLSHPAWSDVSAFLGRTELFFLSSVCSSCTHSQLRRDLFAKTTWRLPTTRGACDRVFQSLTMASVIRRVSIDSAWQQEYLQQLPALESVHISGLRRPEEWRFDLSRSLPDWIKSLHLSGFRQANLEALSVLTSLEELHVEVDVVFGLYVIAWLPNLTRVRLWSSNLSDLKVVNRLSNLQLLDSRWSHVSTNWLYNLPKLERLMLVGWVPEPTSGLRKVAPQLKQLTLQTVEETSGTGTQAVDMLLAALATSSIEQLDMRYTDLIKTSNFAQVGRLTTLKTLQLSLTLDDLSPLAALLELQDLTVVTTSTVDWSPIAGLKNLRFVDQGSQVGDWNPTSMPALSALPLLTLLKRPTYLSDEHPLQYVEELHISYQGHGSVAFDAGCCPRVRKLWITGSVDLATVGPCFPRLESLQCSKFGDCHDVNVLSLAELTRLDFLRVPTGCSNYDGFSFLVGLTAMRRLILSDLPISDIQVVANMKHLRSLFLNRTQVEDISIVTKLENLRVLYIRDTPVTDVAILRGHPQLRRLILPALVDWTVLQDGEEVLLPNCVDIRQGYLLVWPPLLPDETARAG